MSELQIEDGPMKDAILAANALPRAFSLYEIDTITKPLTEEINRLLGLRYDRGQRIESLEAENARLKDELTFAHHIIKNGAQTGEEAAYVFDIPQPPEEQL